MAGVTGFLGTNLAARLVAMGARVRGVSRRHARGPAYAGVEPMHADLTVPADCRRAVDGMDYVFMCAATTSGAAVITSTNCFGRSSSIFIREDFR